MAAAALGGCRGIQSSLDPAGFEAARIASLFWWMAGGALVVWMAVIAVAFYCIRSGDGTPSRRRDRLLIVGGGVAVPLVVLTALLVYSFTMPPLVARAPADALQISVVGEQWWWRVRYERPGGEPVDLANEIRLPVGERVQFG